MRTFAVTYDIVLTKEAQRFYERAEESLIRRLNRCIDQLKQNPYRHPNIRRLKGPFDNHFRYRLGDWRVVYRVDAENHIVIVVIIAHRSRVYR